MGLTALNKGAGYVGFGLANMRHVADLSVCVRQGSHTGGGGETPADARQCGTTSLGGIAGVEDLSREPRLALAKQ